MKANKLKTIKYKYDIVLDADSLGMDIEEHIELCKVSKHEQLIRDSHVLNPNRTITKLVLNYGSLMLNWLYNFTRNGL